MKRSDRCGNLSDYKLETIVGSTFASKAARWKILGREIIEWHCLSLLTLTSHLHFLSYLSLVWSKWCLRNGRGQAQQQAQTLQDHAQQQAQAKLIVLVAASFSIAVP